MGYRLTHESESVKGVMEETMAKILNNCSRIFPNFGDYQIIITPSTFVAFSFDSPHAPRFPVVTGNCRRTARSH